MKRWDYYALAVLGLAFVAITILFVLPRNKKEPTNNSPFAFIANAGKQTEEMLQTSSVEWKTRIITNNGSLEIQNQQQGGILKQTVPFLSPEGQKNLLVVYRAKGLVYIAAEPSHEKYREGEVATLPGQLTMFLEQAKLRILQGQEILSVETRETDRLRVRMINPQMMELANRVLSKGSIAPQLHPKNLVEIKELQEKGEAAWVDLRTGVILERASDQITIQNTPPVTTSKLDLAAEIVREDWIDHTSTLFDPQTADSLMMFEIPARPEAPMNSPTITILFQPKTGLMRRVPILAYSVAGGCFSKDRRKIYVTAGFSISQGLYEVDLVTQQTRRIAPELLFITKRDWDPAISPDGKSLAIVSEVGDKLKTFIIDLEKNRARELGWGLDFATISWTPDSTALIGWLAPEAQQLVGPGEWVIRMDMQGKVTPIMQGRKPVLAPDGRHIIFRHPTDDKWMISELDGSNDVVLDDGYPGAATVAVGPAGYIAIKYPNDKPPPILSVRFREPDIWNPFPPGARGITWR